MSHVQVYDCRGKQIWMYSIHTRSCFVFVVGLEGLPTNITPKFDGSNYIFWSILMEVYLQSLRFDVWQYVENGYKVPNILLAEVVGKRQYE